MIKQSIKESQSRKTKTRNIIQGDIVLNPEFPDVITIRKVQVLDGYCVRMRFSNGETRDLDLKPYLRGPVFEAIRRDPSLFRQVFVDAETETLTWTTGVDMDPETLYEDSVRAQIQQRRESKLPSSTKAVRSPLSKKNKLKIKKKTQPRSVVRLQAKQK